MASAKKIVKKRLKEPDEFITLTEKTYLFITHHSKPIAVGGILILILFLAVFIFQMWGKKNEEKAYQMFSLATEAYQNVSSPYRDGPPQEYKNVLEQFNEVGTKFPGTSSGKLAILYKGNIHLRLGEFDEAIKDYESFLQKAGKGKLYLSFALEGLGYAHEGKKDYEKAVNAFRKNIDLGEGFQRGDTYLGMGRCYEKMGKNKEALDSYKSFLKMSQKSQMTNIVLRKIAHLEK
jgi:tetratricopeptide (TPR) repeat protein